MNKLVAVKEGSAVGVPSEAAAIFSMIERVAAQPDVPLERVEKLFDLYQKMEAERARRAYYAALSIMLPQIPVIARKGRITGNIKDDSGKKIGTQVQSQYAKWEDIVEIVNPVVTEHGFAISFKIDQPTPDRVSVTCTLSHREGHSESTSFALPIDTTGAKNNVQGWGSSVSYAKRYTASALLNIVTRNEDDDGKAAGDAFSVETINDEQFKILADLIKETNSTVEGFCAHIKVESLSDILASKFDAAKGILLTKKKKLAEKVPA